MEQTLNYLSVCSGIEAFSCAVESKGWKPVGFSEIEPFPSKLLEEKYPDVTNFGDMTNFDSWSIDGAVDILVGGTPCQSFSIAGARKGLEDDRGNLALTFCRIADKFQPDWVIWENVPGVLSSRDNAFGCFLAELSGASGTLVPDGRWDHAGLVSGPKRQVAWRVLDSQFFGVPQRRKRVFVLATPNTGNLRSAKALFPLTEGLRWNSAESRKPRKDLTSPTGRRTSPNHWEGGPHPTLNQSSCTGNPGFSNQELFAQRGAYLVPKVYENHPNDSRVKDMGEVASTVSARYGTGGGNTPLVTFSSNMSEPDCNDRVTPPVKIGGRGNNPPAIAFQRSQLRQYGKLEEMEIAPTLGAKTGDKELNLMQDATVRRLMPLECERLQGFPDNWTQIPWRGKPAEDCPDGPRYKALGNSMAVPCMRYLADRIEFVLRSENVGK